MRMCSLHAVRLLVLQELFVVEQQVPGKGGGYIKKKNSFRLASHLDDLTFSSASLGKF